MKRISIFFLSLIILTGCESAYEKSLKERLPSDIDLTNTIIFDADTNSNKIYDPQIFAVKVDSPHTLYQLTNTKYPLSYPVWLPDGSGIMFLSKRFDTYEDNYIGWADDSEIYIIDRNGTRRVVRCFDNLTEKEKKKYDDILNGVISNPIPTTSEKVIYNLFHDRLIIQDLGKSEISLRYIEEESYNLEIFEEFAISRGEKRLAFIGRERNFEFSWPYPDSIHPSAYKYSKEEICVLNIDGTGYKKLTYNNVPERGPCWSKAGEKIYFDRYLNWSIKYKGDFNKDIFVINADGTNEQNLTNSPNTNDYSPEVSPDDKYIAYISKKEDRYTEIWIMDRDGSNKHRILKLQVYGIPDLSWSPK